MVLTITVKHIWIIKDDGLCLTEFNLSNNQSRRVDESVFGAFTASLVKIIMATGLDEEGDYTIVLEKRSLYYYYSNGIVICLQIDKKEKEKKVRNCLEKLHTDFLTRYGTILESEIVIDSKTFTRFKQNVIKTLVKGKLMKNSILY